MSESEEENIIDEAPPTESKRGRPVGKPDSTQRSRRTAQEISDDKIRIAQMKLDALREADERRVANRKTRSRPRKASKAATESKPIVQEIAMNKVSKKPRDESSSPSPKYVSHASKRQALYDSWFTPRTRY